MLRFTPDVEHLSSIFPFRKNAITKFYTKRIVLNVCLCTETTYIEDNVYNNLRFVKIFAVKFNKYIIILRTWIMWSIHFVDINYVYDFV